MGPGQARALAELGPRFVVAVSPPRRSTSASPSAAARRWCWRSASAWATPRRRSPPAAPDTDFLGIEVHPPGVGALLKRIGELRPRRTCASSSTTRSRCSSTMIAPASLAGVHVFFPDPWHKKRHHKRRLIQPRVRAPAGEPARAGRLPALRDRLGALRASRCSRCCRPSRALRNTAAGYAPRPDATGR